MPRRTAAKSPPTSRRATAAKKTPTPRKAKAARGAPAADALLERLEGLAQRFEAGCESLGRALAELPRPHDFQPLADHLYEFARAAPALAASLDEVPRAAARIQESVRPLEQLAETLHFAHERFNDSLLRLPRAEDYEPLAAPLAEFARVSPALAESLSEVLRVVRPLGGAVKQLEDAGRELGALEGRLRDALETKRPPAGPAPASPAAANGHALRAAAHEAADCMRAAAATVAAALGTLPREPAYATLAAQLRELATVSPSLMEWLTQTPALTAPLTASVDELRAATARLDAGRERLAEALAGGTR